MKLIQLKFQTISELWEFKRSINSVTYGIDTSKLTLRCECTDHDLEIAETSFHAVAVEDDLICTE